MDKYIGAKLIQAEPERNPVTKEITGYKVVYPDGYESWSPKDVFEKAYMKVDDNKVSDQKWSMILLHLRRQSRWERQQQLFVVCFEMVLISWNHLRVLIQRITMKRSAKIFAWEVSKTRSGNC